MLNPSKKKKKRDITYKQFDFIYKNKIQKHLEDNEQFKFTDMNLLLNAYEYWRYENINKQTFSQLDQDKEERDTDVYAPSFA